MIEIDKAINKIMDDFNAHSEMMVGTTEHFERVLKTEEHVDPIIMIESFKILWNGLSKILEKTIELVRSVSEEE